MNAEEKQALIQRILNIKTSGKANRFEITELAEIALAALTAQPVKLPTRRSILTREDIEQDT